MSKSTFGTLQVGQTFRFRSDPMREVCRKLGPTSYEGTRTGRVYDAARVPSGISALSVSDPVVVVRS